MESSFDAYEFLKAEIAVNQPRNILQLGLGDVDDTLILADLLEQVPGAALTLIESAAREAQYDQDTRAKLKALCERSSVERIGAPFDEALPDFYFQHHCWDMVIMNPFERFDQALVALYYLDKMLLSQGELLLWGTDTPVMARLCLQIQENNSYQLVEQWGVKPPSVSLGTRLLRTAMAKAPASIERLARLVLNPRLWESEGKSPVFGRSVLLRKPMPLNEADMDFDTLLAVLSKE